MEKFLEELEFLWIFPGSGHCPVQSVTLWFFSFSISHLFFPRLPLSRLFFFLLRFFGASFAFLSPLPVSLSPSPPVPSLFFPRKNSWRGWPARRSTAIFLHPSFVKILNSAAGRCQLLFSLFFLRKKHRLTTPRNFRACASKSLKILFFQQPEDGMLLDLCELNKNVSLMSLFFY